MLYSSSAVTTVHMIGQSANTAPLATEFSASAGGIRHTVIAFLEEQR